MTEVAASSPLQIASPPRRLDRLSRIILGGLTGYFLLHILLRLVLSDSLVLDEAEQVLLAQQLQWGYGPQPPLYNWLQAGFFHLLGTNLLAMAVLKNLLLLGGYWLMFLSVRRMTGREPPAVLAALSLLLMPEISWEAQRDLTHSVVLLTSTLASLWVLVRLLQSPHLGWYAALGVAAAAGALSKYNFGLFLLPALLAAATLTPFRRAVLNWRMLVAAACFAALTFMHVLWSIDHQAETLSHREDFFRPDNTPLGSLGEIAGGGLRYLLGVLIFYGLFFFRGLYRPTPEDAGTPFERLLFRTGVIGLVGLSAAAMVVGVTSIHARWLQPLMLVIVAWLAVRVRGSVTPGAVKGLASVAFVVAVAVMLALSVRTFYPRNKARQPLNAPFDALARQIRDAGFTGGTIIAADKQVGGNLHLAFPGSRTIVPELTFVSPLTSGDRLVVWNVAQGTGYRDRVIAFAESLYGPQATWPSQQFVEAPVKYAPRGTMQLGFVLLRGAATTRPVELPSPAGTIGP